MQLVKRVLVDDQRGKVPDLEHLANAYIYLQVRKYFSLKAQIIALSSLARPILSHCTNTWWWWVQTYMSACCQNYFELACMSRSAAYNNVKARCVLHCGLGPLSQSAMTRYHVTSPSNQPLASAADQHGRN